MPSTTTAESPAETASETWSARVKDVGFWAEWAALVGLVAYYVGQAAADAISHYGLIGGAVVVGVAVAGLVALHFWRKRLVEQP